MNASASSMGTVVGLLIDGRNEPWRWRIRRADGATSRGGISTQRWVQISAKLAHRLQSYGHRRRLLMVGADYLFHYDSGFVGVLLSSIVRTVR